MCRSQFLKVSAVALLALSTLSPAEAAPPPNDNFANATVLTAASGGLPSDGITEATSEPGEPGTGGDANVIRTIWYKWTAPSDGEFELDSGGCATGPLGSDLWKGTSVDALVAVPAQHQSTIVSAGVCGQGSTLILHVRTGDTLYIQLSIAYKNSFVQESVSYQFRVVPDALLAAVLPSARSVTEGSIATAYAAIINTGAAAVQDCKLMLPVSVNGDFQFRASDAANNFVKDSNDGIDVKAGATQNFVFGVTPKAELDSVDIPLIFDCIGSLPVSSISGLNTFLLSASATAVPDLVSIGVTASGDGIADIQGATGSGLFVASTINIGVASTITASVDTNGITLPVQLTICRTDPATGACTNPATPGLASTFNLANSEIGTFTIFVAGVGIVPFDPANNRLFLRFKTPDGITRGATSVAVRTQ
jgi:hypothetical protein